MIRIKLLGVIVLTVLFISEVYSQKEKLYIRKGNKSYYSEQFDKSEEAYKKASEQESNADDHYKALFNLGNAFYKQKKLDESIQQFNSLKNSDIKVNNDDMHKVYHNLGNSYLMNGKIQESIDSYEEALRKDPTDMETKYNLAYAQHMLKQQQQQKQNQQNQQNQQQQNKDQQQQPNPDKMTKDQADKMLKALQNDENQLQKDLNKDKAKAVQQNIEKDW